MNLGEAAIAFVVFLFSLTIHEAAHAWTSEKFGDDTGRWMGRVSLNPAVHIDLFGTILFPLMTLLTAGTIYFGWAKPVPVNPSRWRDHFWGNIAVSGAGPASNLILAFIAGALFKILLMTGLWTNLAGAGLQEPIGFLLRFMIMLNIGLAVFNMIPIPPLDGSHILSSLLSVISPTLMDAYEGLREYGFVILLIGIVTGLLNMICAPVFKIVTLGLVFLLGL
ncbi:MAG: site-2 protease family protein [Acidobacteria bacterium]|nr:site-2 protease family protein [Acidobacteriota bacterium]